MTPGTGPVEAPPRWAGIDVPAVMEHLETAADLLAGSGPGGVLLAGQRLAWVESMLTERLADPVPAVPAANWVLMARNDLSVHLSAARTLHAEGLHARAGALLEGAIATLRSRLDPSRPG